MPWVQGRQDEKLPKRSIIFFHHYMRSRITTFPPTHPKRVHQFIVTLFTLKVSLVIWGLSSLWTTYLAPFTAGFDSFTVIPILEWVVLGLGDKILLAFDYAMVEEKSCRSLKYLIRIGILDSLYAYFMWSMLSIVISVFLKESCFKTVVQFRCM